MSTSLAARIHAAIRQVLEVEPGAWMVWCDPRGEWAPLLERVAANKKLGGFTLVRVEESTAGETGSPLARRQLAEKLAARESLVLLVGAPPTALGWLWAQAILAERTYSLSLREQLVEWGWKPHDLTQTESELAALARQKLGQDPAKWSADPIQPDPTLLIRVLAALESPDPDNSLVLDRTIESVGLSPIGGTDLTLWRKKALASLLITQADQAVPGAVPQTHDLLIAAAQRESALRLLESWNDSVTLRRLLPTLIKEADAIANPALLVTMRLRAADAGWDFGPLFSRTAELAVFAGICAHLASLQGKALLERMAATHPLFAKHAAGLWAETRPGILPIPWSEPARLASAASTLLTDSPTEPWADPEQAITWYTGGGWRLDQAGEELLRLLDNPGAELTALLGPLREAFRNRWEDLAIRWSEVWREAGYSMAGLSTAGELVKAELAGSGPIAVLVADALRYDQGAVLAEGLNAAEGAERAHVFPARAPLPSITALGMGQALPIAGGELRADFAAGAWHLHPAGSDLDLSDAADRRTWWQTHGQVPLNLLLHLKAVLEQEIPSPDHPRARLVIYDDAIDQLGHDDELEAIGAGAIVERYIAAIGKLRDAGWRRVLVTTDHGYIHWSGTAEQASPPPAPTPTYSSRRALAYPAGTLPDIYPTAPGRRYQVALPAGAAIFKTYGGKGYFHGGGSLQEWVIPVVKVEWPVTARPVEVAVQPLKSILTLRPKLVLEVRRPSLLVEDALARRVTVVIRNIENHDILFRSSEHTIAPDRDTLTLALERTPATAKRGTPARIEIRDALTEEVIASADSILSIEIDQWDDGLQD